MVILIWTTNYYTSIYDIFLPTSGLTGTQDWLFVMKNNQCCVGASLLWIIGNILLYDLDYKLLYFNI